VIVNLSDKSPGMQEHAGGLMYLCVWFRKSEIRISNGHTPVDWKPLEAQQLADKRSKLTG
jgi:hypothetical protein